MSGRGGGGWGPFAAPFGFQATDQAPYSSPGSMVKGPVKR
jgi:hypothetical protein